MKEHLKNIASYIAVTLILVAIVAVGINLAPLLSRQSSGTFGTVTQDVITLAGSSANFTLLPYSMVFDSSTTTKGYTDGGLITQQFGVDGRDKLRLQISGKGSVSTSTVYVQLQISTDNVNFYDITTTTPPINGTSTPTVAPTVRGFTMGTATSSYAFDFDVTGARFVRTVMYAPTGTHLNRATKAFIQAIKINSVAR